MPPRLLLLPGMDGTGTLFRALVREGGKKYECIVVSYPPDEPLEYKALETIAQASLPKTGKVFVLGESFSGPIAISMAASCPERVEGVILCCTFASSPLKTFGRLADALGDLTHLISSTSLARYILVGRRAPPGVDRDLKDAIKKVRPNVLRTRLRAVGSVDVREKLSGSRLPLLYLQARNDWLVSSRSLEEIAHLRPDVRIERLPGPHCLLQVAPLPAAKVIESFMEQHQRK